VTDEFSFLLPVSIIVASPWRRIRDGDSSSTSIFVPTRPQITRCLAGKAASRHRAAAILPDAEALDAHYFAQSRPKNLKYICMTQYDKQFTLPFVVQPDSLKTFWPT